MANNNVRYLNPIQIDTKREKYCRFTKAGIKYIDYKDADFLLMLCNEQLAMDPPTRARKRMPKLRIPCRLEARRRMRRRMRPIRSS